MGALFQIELEGFVEQSVGIADPAGAPHLGLHLCRAHLIAGAVGLDVLLVPVDLVQSHTGGGVIGDFAVHRQRKGDLRGVGDDGAIGRLNGVESGFRNLHGIGKRTLCAVPDQDVVPHAVILRAGIRADLEGIAVRLRIIRSVQDKLRIGMRRICIGVVITAVRVLLLVVQASAGVCGFLSRRSSGSAGCRFCGGRQRQNGAGQEHRQQDRTDFLVPFHICQSSSTLLSAPARAESMIFRHSSVRRSFPQGHIANYTENKRNSSRLL